MDRAPFRGGIQTVLMNEWQGQTKPVEWVAGYTIRLAVSIKPVLHTASKEFLPTAVIWSRGLPLQWYHPAGTCMLRFDILSRMPCHNHKTNM